MKIRKYIAKNNFQIIDKIKEEIGDDAVILHSNIIRPKGFFKFFKKPVIEVYVGIEDENNFVDGNEINIDELNIKMNKQRNNSLFFNEGKIISEEIFDENLKEELLKKFKRKNPNISKIVSKIDTDIEKLRDQIDNKILEYEQKSKKNVNNDQNIYKNSIKYDKIEVKEQNKKNKRKNVDFNSLDEELKQSYYKYYKRLLDRNVKLEYVEYIFAFVLNKLPENPSVEEFETMLAKYISFKLGDVYTIDHNFNERQMFLFLGPTGVGKTTVLAKLAARISLLNQKEVGLITADTYRIAAIEQLKTYSEIIDIPIKVAYEPKDLIRQLDEYKNKDFILIDTAGHSHKTNLIKEDIIELLNVDKNIQKFLVLSLVTSANDIVSIIKSYEFLDDYRLIFTKLDETDNIGNILNARFASNKPISFITNGQNVPDDIMVASKKDITRLLLGD